MNAICINGKVKDQQGYNLPEMEPLEVWQSEFFPGSFRVQGYLYGRNGNKTASYKKARFMITSNIDEMELLNKRESNLATA